MASMSGDSAMRKAFLRPTGEKLQRVTCYRAWNSHYWHQSIFRRGGLWEIWSSDTRAVDWRLLACYAVSSGWSKPTRHAMPDRKHAASMSCRELGKCLPGDRVYLSRKLWSSTRTFHCVAVCIVFRISSPLVPSPKFIRAIKSWRTIWAGM